MAERFSISFDQNTDRALDAMVANGRFATVEAAIAYAVERLVADDAHYQTQIPRLRDAIEVGHAEAERGEGTDARTVIARHRERYNAPRSKSD